LKVFFGRTASLALPKYNLQLPIIPFSVSRRRRSERTIAPLAHDTFNFFDTLLHSLPPSQLTHTQVSHLPAAAAAVSLPPNLSFSPIIDGPTAAAIPFRSIIISPPYFLAALTQLGNNRPEKATLKLGHPITAAASVKQLLKLAADAAAISQKREDGHSRRRRSHNHMVSLVISSSRHV
jgi:hypothetical protein